MIPPAPPSTADLQGALGSLSHAVPIQVLAPPGTVIPPLVATFFRVTPDGAIEQELETVPIENGQALYTNGPLPTGSRWAITVQEPGGLPIYRSGPLAKLPGPISPLVPFDRIRIFRANGGSFGLDAPDGLPEIARERLRHLPAELRRVRVDQEVFSGDAQGREIIKVLGRVRSFFLWRHFTYARLLVLRPNPHPGHPASIVFFDSGGPDIATGASLGFRAPALSAAIGGAALAQLDAALQQIARIQNDLFQIDFQPTVASATHLEVRPNGANPSLLFTVHGGAITGGLGDVFEDV